MHIFKCGWYFIPKQTFFEGEGGGGGSASDAVDQAAKDLENKGKKDEPDDDDEPDDEEKEELEKAKQLFAIMKDPVARKAFLTQMMESEGLNKDSSKKEITQAKKNIESILKTHLGDEYDILHGKLTKGLTEILELFFEEKVKPFGERLSANEAKEERKLAESAWDSVFAEYSNSKELENAVAELCEEIRPKKDQDPKVYFRRLLKIAADEKGIELKKVSAKDNAVLDFTKNRRKDNSSDIDNRLKDKGADEGKMTRNPSLRTSLEDAIAAGAAEAEKKLKGR